VQYYIFFEYYDYGLHELCSCLNNFVRVLGVVSVLPALKKKRLGCVYVFDAPGMNERQMSVDRRNEIQCPSSVQVTPFQALQFLVHFDAGSTTVARLCGSMRNRPK